MNPNDPAFPQEAKRFHDPESFGMTKREYFAAMAMQGQLASMTNAEVVKALKATEAPEEWCALSAVRFADALIKELSKKPFTEQTERMK